MKISLISVVIPVLNESRSMEELLERIDKIFDSIKQKYEVIFVDDGSTDESFSILKKFTEKYPSLKIIRHHSNFGKSLALMQGFDNAKGEVAIMMDGDLQDQPEMIPRFIEKIKEGYDLVNGWRQRRNDDYSKNLLSKVFNFFTSLVFRNSMRDINCGFKALRRDVFESLELKEGMHRLIPAIAAMKGFKGTDIPIEHEKRKYGQSNYSLWRVTAILDVLYVAILFSPIRPFYGFFKLAIVAFMAGLVMFFCLILTNTNLSGEIIWTASSLFFFTSGLIFLFASVILPGVGLVVDLLGTHNRKSQWRQTFIKEKVFFEDN
jgi:glycosyltransferase involved in cell wall biosynthesis